MRARRALLAALLLVSLAGCAAQRADRLFAAGDFAAAIEAYEQRLERRSAPAPADAPVLLNLALAYSRDGHPRHDPELAEHYLRVLVDALPAAPEAQEARWLLAATAAHRRVAELELELEQRDEQLARLNAVLQLVAEAENRLRSEVEDQDEERADLEGRIEALSRRARGLAAEVAGLETELEALKRIDLESATRGTDGPP